MIPWPRRLEQWRSMLAVASTATGVPMSLLAAIMDRESRGGEALSPPGPHGTGDVGHGHGLMQIDDRSWAAFTGDKSRWTDPQANITFGAGILASNYRAFEESWPPAICAYNAGPGRVNRYMMMRPSPTIEELDQLTTDKNYVSWVLGCWSALEGDDTFGDVEGGWSTKGGDWS